jgi:glutathione peroxidase
MKNLILILSLIFIPNILMANCPDLLNQEINNIQGDSVNMCDLSGKVILAVNTASRCGYTPQYKSLQKLYEKYSDQGLIIVGFPSGDFGGQELKDNKEIKDFCEINYGVKFPIFSKTHVKGPEANDFFAKLIKASGDVPKWNFHKYLVSKDTSQVLSYSSSVEPLGSDLEGKIKEFLN